MAIKPIDEQRYIWVMRAMSVSAVLALGLMAIMFLAIEKIAPGEKFAPYLITLNTGNVRSFTIVREEGIPPTIMDTIARRIITKYVVDRESMFANRTLARGLIDGRSDIAMFSTSEEYERFRTSPQFTERANNPDRQIVTIEIAEQDIRPIVRLGYWEVAFTRTITNARGLERHTERGSVNICAGFVSGALVKPAGESLWRNPLGFYITRYQYGAEPPQCPPL